MFEYAQSVVEKLIFVHVVVGVVQARAFIKGQSPLIRITMHGQ